MIKLNYWKKICIVSENYKLIKLILQYYIKLSLKIIMKELHDKKKYLRDFGLFKTLP
jgi:hypothetical protein